jgi:hypothetical protein
MAFIVDIYNAAGGRAFTIFSANSNSFFSPRGRGNPSPSSIVAGDYADNLQRFSDAENSIYGRPTLGAGSSFPFNFGFRQPYVFVSPSDSAFRRQIKKFDSRSFPVGSVIQDEERLGKMLISGHGIKFLGTQQLLQFQAPFDETNIYNPLSVPLAAARPASFGLLPRPTRHIQQGNGVLGAFKSMFGFGASSNIPPSSTVGQDGLPDAGLKNGTGLLRGRTSSGGKAHFDGIWVGGSNPQGILGSFLKKLKNAVAPSLGASKPEGVKYRADEGSYDIFLTDLSKGEGSILKIGAGTETIRGDLHRYKSGVTEEETYKTARGKSGTFNRDSSNSNEDNLRNRFINSFVNPSLQSSLELYPDQASVDNMTKRMRELNEKAKTSEASFGDDPFSSERKVNRAGSHPSNGYYKSETSEQSGLSIEGESRESKYKFSDKDNIDPINHSGLMDKDEFKNDKIYGGGKNDIIPFYFHDLVNDKYIVFRATLKSISQNTTPEWVDIKYMGSY